MWVLKKTKKKKCEKKKLGKKISVLRKLGKKKNGISKNKMYF